MEIARTFESVVQHLESLSIMPKEMPGIEKLKIALSETEWFSEIDAKKVIVVAGTNGKGSTCAILESLLASAGQKVGFYSSPHLIDTTERIRVQQQSITKKHFTELFFANEERIKKHQLTHFEALTLMAGEYFFYQKWDQHLDYVIFEVGLGGLFDATNAMPHATSIITLLGLDHTQILGSDLVSIAKNKFGIVQDGNLVVHHPLAEELEDLKLATQKKTKSRWIVAEKFSSTVEVGPRYWIDSKWGKGEINLPGKRAAENAATALTTIAALGFNPSLFLSALKQVDWPGRMQQVGWPGLKAKLFLSGDHNRQGIQSLVDLLKDYTYQNIHVVVGIGKDKDAEEMLLEIQKIPHQFLYLTETPFKGLKISEYPNIFLQKAKLVEADFFLLLDKIKNLATEQDLVLVTGSLYLVGEVLKTSPPKIAP